MAVCDYSGELLSRGWQMLMAVCDYSGEFLYQVMADAYGCL